MVAIKQVLAAAAGLELPGKIEELLLATTEAAIDHARDGGAALDLARKRRFELIVTELPLPGLDLEGFLERLREPRSSSREAAVIIQTGSLERHRIEALGGERLAGVDICTTSRQTLCAVTHRLRLSDRLSARLKVTLEGATESFCGRQLALTRNISPSGMLLTVEHLLPVGMVAPISIELSRREPMIHGSAEVVRHADPQREEIIGMGMRFVRLFGDGGERLTDFVLASDRGEPAGAAARPG